MARTERLQRTAQAAERRLERHECKCMAMADRQSQRAHGGGSAARRIDRWATTARRIDHCLQRLSNLSAASKRRAERAREIQGRKDEAAKQRVGMQKQHGERCAREAKWRWLMTGDRTMTEIMGSLGAL